MYAGVGTYQVKLDKIDQAIEIWSEYLVKPAKFHGLKRGFFLTNRETGKCLGIGWWDNKRDADKFSTTGEWAQLVEKLETVLAAAAVREEYDVSVEV